MHCFFFMIFRSPEEESKIDNLSLNQCLESSSQAEPPELSQSDLTGLVSSLDSSLDPSLSEVDVDLLNQLNCNLELDTFLHDFTNIEVKVENYARRWDLFTSEKISVCCFSTSMPLIHFSNIILH